MFSCTYSFHVYGRSVPFRKSPAQANGIIGAEGGMHAEGGGDARNRLSTAVADLPWLWFGAFPGQRVEVSGRVIK